MIARTFEALEEWHRSIGYQILHPLERALTHIVDELHGERFKNSLLTEQVATLKAIIDDKREEIRQLEALLDKPKANAIERHDQTD